MATKKAKLVFITTPGMGHLVSTVEVAKRLVDLNEQLSIALLIIKIPFDSKANDYIQSLTAISNSRIQFIQLPEIQISKDIPPNKFFPTLLETQKPHVKEAVTGITAHSDDDDDPPPLAGFVLDMFCMTMMDVANECGVPSYVFFTSGAAFLRFMFYLQTLHEEENVDTTELKDFDTEFAFPGFINPLPAKSLPTVVLKKEWIGQLLDIAKRFKQTKGILVNTFMELESHATKSLCEGETQFPPVYTVGPILNLTSNDQLDNGSSSSPDIMKWLDDQPLSSVVFLCFGSMGSFNRDQVKEIAVALEQSGQRFLWSLRQPPPKDAMVAPTDYQNLEEVLPEGFLDRTAGVGKVIGWAPQVTILAHPAVGGFVSHCGWNSTLESIWFGKPSAAWPMYAEQQLNAFEMVVELGLAFEIKLDNRKGYETEGEEIVSAGEVQRGIERLMEEENDIRKKVKEMSEKSRKALMEGGSSYTASCRFIHDAMDIMP